MSVLFIPVAIFLPVALGAALFMLKPSKKLLGKYVSAAVFACSLLAWALILFAPHDAVTVIRFTNDLSVTFALDGLGRLFSGIVATLWPLTTLYALEYMKHDERQISFFAFFVMAFGITLGVAMSGNIVTMYCFYELLTLVTIPLVMHPLTDKAVRAARTYMICSIGGAAFAFVAVVFLVVNGGGAAFVYGGSAENIAGNAANLIYFLGFMGFGVKAAVFPMDFWLPRAAVAPTPVTALLHAVAVVKSGVFAVMRLTFFCYGAENLIGTPAQIAAASFAIFTIVYGSAMALKEVHFKRRLAYSTISNLSYILFGVTLMTKAGLAAALLHMVAHAVIKILGFFCAGAVMHRTGLEYVYELDGLGKYMPVTFGCYTVSALALCGIPPFIGFVSKWSLLTAAAEAGTAVAYVGAAGLIISALLTALYMFPPAVRAFFPRADGRLAASTPPRRASALMAVPMLLLAALSMLLGVFAQPLQNLAGSIAGGLM